MDFQEITQYEKKLYDKGIKYVAGIDEVGRGPLAGPFVVSAVILDLEKIFNPDFQKMLSGNVVEKGIELKSVGIKGKNKEMNKKIGGEKSIEDVKKSEEEVCRNNDEKHFKNFENSENNILLYKQIRDSKKVTPKRREILSEFIKTEAISYSIEVFEPEEIDNLGISELTQKAFFQAIKKLKIKPQYVLTDTFEVAKITKDHQQNIINGDGKSLSIASASIVAKVFRDNLMVEEAKKYPEYSFEKHKGYGTKVHIEALMKFGPCKIHRKSLEPIKSILGM